MTTVLQLIIVIIGFILIFFFTSNLIRFVLIAFWYPLLPMFLFCEGFPIGRAIDLIGRPIYAEYANSAFFFAAISYFCFCVVLWRERKQILKFRRIHFGEPFRLLLGILLLIVSIIAYPKVYGLSNYRWNLIPGQWSVVYLAINYLLLVSFKRIQSPSTLLHIVILFKVLSGGERVDSLIVVALIGLLYVEKNAPYKLTERKLSLKWTLLFIVLLFFGIYIGQTRSGASTSLFKILYDIIALHTVTDVIHVYFSSFDYVSKQGTTFKPLINELFSLIPTHPLGGQSEYNFSRILNKHIVNPGGGLFYTEGMLIFGSFGIVLYGIMYGLFFKYLINNNKQYAKVILLIFFILQLRIQWYGTIYLYSTVIFTIIVIGLYNFVRSQKSLNFQHK